MDSRVINFPAIQQDDSSPQFLIAVSEIYKRVRKYGPVLSVRTLFFRCLEQLSSLIVQPIDYSIHPDARSRSWWIHNAQHECCIMLSGTFAYREGLVLLGDILWKHVQKISLKGTIHFPCDLPIDQGDFAHLFARVLLMTLAYQSA